MLDSKNDIDNNYVDASGVNGADDEDVDEEGFFNMRKPTSWCDCLCMMLQQNEERLLMIQNPDGLLYLTYLKQSGLFFFIRKCI